MPTPSAETPPEVPGQVTDPSRVHGEQVSFAGAGGTPIGGYLARPSDDQAHPGLIVIHEAAGITGHIRDVTHRFANQGYATLAPDLYARTAPPPAGDMEAILKTIFAIRDDQVLGDLEGAAGFLTARPEVTDRLGCIGFCMGGRYTLLFATSGDHLAAAVDCWGGFIDRATMDRDATPERPVPPLDLVPRLHCPLMAAVGAQDQNPSPELAETLRERLDATDHETSVRVYDDAGHAFFNDTRPNFSPQAAAQLWADVLPFLARHLRT